MSAEVKGGDPRLKNIVHEQAIWAQRVGKELKLQKEWHDSWGFLLALPRPHPPPRSRPAYLQSRPSLVGAARQLTGEGATLTLGSTYNRADLRVESTSIPEDELAKLMHHGRFRYQMIASKTPKEKLRRPMTTSQEVKLGWRRSLERFGVNHGHGITRNKELMSDRE
ncbi:unnamed protein product [Vitrella brassicaformis CCMP3155]|uniref:Uncharacterized protein n=1 Tax=Vitrella brassicaformis (strain CCMP3155) TaxID=1169540 RepID=A0A0G4GYA4_VITBC|nr:unnamed protein product [Vitrella brassicaformis CCMP3155]|eukprot:CEM36113.1 unnamed protein product [Vitrella brassicaformis CCMP3155]